jgi:hypothetical protein
VSVSTISYELIDYSNLRQSFSLLRSQASIVAASASTGFCNSGFGAVLESPGFSYYETQNIAGAASDSDLCGWRHMRCRISSRSVSVCDQVSDAVVIQRGFNYKIKKQAGCN